jgi:hypothetical protein
VSFELFNVVRHLGICAHVALDRRLVAGDDVRIPDPDVGRATVISRYGKERAMLLHPADFHRLDDFDGFLTAVSQLPPLPVSAEGTRAHREEDTPGRPITDPAVLAELFG